MFYSGIDLHKRSSTITTLSAAGEIIDRRRLREVNSEMKRRDLRPMQVRDAEPDGRFDQRIEHRLEIEGRAADDLEDVGGGGLLLERLVELTIARRQLGEQTDILDSNDGLSGECFQQLDLPLREKSGLGSRN